MVQAHYACSMATMPTASVLYMCHANLVLLVATNIFLVLSTFVNLHVFRISVLKLVFFVFVLLSTSNSFLE